jgi:transposase InsO family protein
MGQSLKKYIKNCRQCVLGKSHTGRRAGLWQRGERPSSALDVWHIDHAGPLVKSHGCTQLLVVIDAFSKYCSLRPIRKKNTEDTIRALALVFEQMGKPRRIIADRTAAFASLTVQNFLADQEVQLHHIATGMPRENGQVEHTRTVFNLVRVSLTAQNEKNWVHEISAIENNINATVHGTTGYPPNALHFATNPRLKV